MIRGPWRCAGRLSWVARDAAMSAAVGRYFEAWNGPFGIHGEFVRIGGVEAYFKAEPLTGRARWRHGLRRWVLRRPYPRLAEYENLNWLREHGFSTAQPLAAGVRRAWNGIAWQFLMTERFEGTEPLVTAGVPVSSERLVELAREVARMHGLGFIHRDLHLRNLAWRLGGDGSQVLFYDAWRGGARPQSRGVAYDLACLTAGLGTQAGEQSAEEFMGLYLAARGEPSKESALLVKVRHERGKLARKHVSLGKG